MPRGSKIFMALQKEGPVILKFKNSSHTENLCIIYIESKRWNGLNGYRAHRNPCRKFTYLYHISMYVYLIRFQRLTACIARVWCRREEICSKCQAQCGLGAWDLQCEICTKHSNIHIFKHSYIQIFKHSNIQCGLGVSIPQCETCTDAHIQTFKHSYSRHLWRMRFNLTFLLSIINQSIQHAINVCIPSLYEWMKLRTFLFFQSLGFKPASNIHSTATAIRRNLPVGFGGFQPHHIFSNLNYGLSIDQSVNQPMNVSINPHSVYTQNHGLFENLTYLPVGFGGFQPHHPFMKFQICVFHSISF